MVLSGRICSIVLALAAMAMAPLIDTSGSLYNYLQKINAAFFGPMLAVILLGFLTKRVSPIAAKIGLIIGPVFFYLLVFSFGEHVQSLLRSLLFLEEEVHFLHFLAFVFLFVAGLMLVVSWFRPAQKIYQQSYTQDVDITPWRHAKTVSLILSAATISCYVLLAQ
jgi:SSS family solute:Na+ symporter